MSDVLSSQGLPTNELNPQYHFGGYTLHSLGRKLRDPEGEQVNLSSRAFETLLVLVKNQGEILTKSQLMEAVWPAAVVEENNLNQAIYSLRKALGDSKNESRFILTLPGKGYTFVAPVEITWSENPQHKDSKTTTATLSWLKTISVFLLARPAPMILGILLLAAVTGTLFNFYSPIQEVQDASQVELTAASLIQTTALTTSQEQEITSIKNSIAVLPFTNLDTQFDNELFSLGLHDEVINQLSKISNLNVIARNSILSLVNQQLPLEEIARLLKVESFLSGTILLVGNQARITLHMHDASTGVMLWSGDYEANQQDLAEMISIQSDIATQVARALEAEIGQTEQDRITSIPTESFEAYRFNLAARNARSQMDFANEWNLARQAIALDPGYFDAHYNFSGVNTILVATPLPGMTPQQHFDLALTHADKLIELAPERSEGYVLKAISLSTVKDWDGVSRMLNTLNSMNTPANELGFLALLLLNFGDFENAIEIYKANLIREPLNLFARGFLMVALELSGNRDEARQEYALGEELSPFWWGDNVNIFLALGRNEPLQDIDELLMISDDLKSLLHRVNDQEVVAAALEDYHWQETKVSAEAIYYAALAAHINNHELAVELLHDSLNENWSALMWAWLPVFDDTRKLESFRELLAESGMVAYWQEHGWRQMCQPAGDTFSCDWKAYPW